MVINIDAAKHEFITLKRLYLASVKVPKPVININHVIVMQLIEGQRLTNVKLENAENLLLSLFDEIRKAYNNGIIGADLSAYNILYDGNDLWFIDFPQSVETNHPNAYMLLRRDVKNILDHFRKRYNIKYDLDYIMNYIIDVNNLDC